MTGVALLVTLSACRHSEPPPLARPWQVVVLQPDDTLDARLAVQGVVEGLGAAGLQPDRDYVLTVRDALGQPGTLPELARAAVEGGANTVVAIGTQSLQAALAASSQMPIVFTDVADPGIAGVHPRSLWQRWVPWLFGDDRPAVTGAYASGGLAALIEAGASLTPGTWGAIVAGGDADSVGYREALRRAADAARRAVEFEAVADPAEVAAAAKRLCGRGVTALIALGDPVTDAAFAALVEAARTCGVPVLGTLRAHADAATVTVVRETKEAGRQAGRLVGRIASGADPRALDVVTVEEARLIVNADAAESAGVGLPLSLVQRADEVIGD